MNVLSLFSGIGALDLGLARAGMTIVGQVELKPFCRDVLAKHWPDVPRHDDVCTAAQWWTARRRPPVDLICGGFPCQNISSANVVNRDGLDGAKSGLWRSFREVVVIVRPQWVLIENSPEWPTWTPHVRKELGRHGYRSVALVIAAGSLGAAHRRRRGLVVAHADGEGEPLRALHAKVAGLSPVPRRGSREALPRAVGADDGPPHRMDRIRALGNAVHVDVAKFIGSSILELESR